MKAPSEREVDEHGFPVPVTFDDPSKKRAGRSCCGRRAWLWALFGVFFLLLAGAIKNSPVIDYGRQFMAARLMERAQEKYLRANDLAEALADLDRAQSWTPDDPEIYQMRGQFRREAGDLEGSLADYDQLVKLRPKFSGGYLGRSVTYQRLNRHREAIDDLNQAVELGPTGDPLPLNNRAYARAVANMELEEAMIDVQLALDRTPEVSPSYSAYLDTRGYLHFLLGRPEAAVVDLDAAIHKSEVFRRETLKLYDERGIPRRARARIQQQFDHELAVMHHHRALAHEKLGHQEQAEADRKQADLLGYDPAAGVF